MDPKTLAAQGGVMLLAVYLGNAAYDYTLGARNRKAEAQVQAKAILDDIDKKMAEMVTKLKTP